MNPEESMNREVQTQAGADSTPKSNQNTNNGGSRGEDRPDPYFVSSSESPNQGLVTDLLNENNYHTWKIAIVRALESKVKLEFVDGSLPEPEVGSRTHLSWRRANSMVSSWLLNSVKKEFATSLMRHKTARIIWRDIENRFSQGTHSRICEIKKEINTMRQGALSVNGFYAKFSTVYAEYQGYTPSFVCKCQPMCNCGVFSEIEAFKNREFCIDFLNGLNDCYDMVRDQILLKDPLPDISLILSTILKCEKQKLNAPPEPNMDISAMLAKYQQYYNRQNNTNSSQTQSAKNNNNNPQGNNAKGKNNLFCTNCKRRNHVVKNCYELVGYPAGYKFANGRSPPSANMTQQTNDENAPTQAYDNNNTAQDSQPPAFTADQHRRILGMIENLSLHPQVNSFKGPAPNSFQPSTSHANIQLPTMAAIGLGVAPHAAPSLDFAFSLVALSLVGNRRNNP